jgi:acetyl esterase
MSALARPLIADAAARAMQRVLALTLKWHAHLPGGFSPLTRFPDLPRDTRELTIATSVASAKAVVYLPPDSSTPRPVYVNFHGGGYILPFIELDDPLCRYLAAEANVVVLNVDYAVAPRHRFPAPPRQAFEIVRWVAAHGADQGWDGTRLVVGGQSAGGGLAAAVARQALEEGVPPIALQVLHYAPLDLATATQDKHSATAKPMLRPWMGEIFNTAYLPNPRQRTDRLASPAGAADTADLTGIAPALVITAEHDLLRAEGASYAERLRRAGALAELYEVPGLDHAYDMKDPEAARVAYARIARHVRDKTAKPSAAE